MKEATIDIWILTLDDQDTVELKEDPSMNLAIKDDNKKRIEEIIIETLEAEVVLLIRQKYDHWPSYQSEIQFHQFKGVHRDIAKKILDPYRSP